MTDNDVLAKAWKANVLVPRFSVPFLPMLEPIVKAVIDQNSFALISSAPIEWKLYGNNSLELFWDEFHKWADRDHMRIHLDHIASRDEATNQPSEYFKIAKEAIEIGYPSIMIDGSHEETFDDNIKVTRKVADLAHEKGVLVEAEVGEMLTHDLKDFPSYETFFAKRVGFTTVENAKRMVREGACDWLAVAVGNIHGAMIGKASANYKDEARLDVELIGQLREATGVPLVLHGGSGIRKEDLHAGVKKGIAKICIGQDIRLRYQQAIEETNKVSAAQDIVYDRVCRLIKEIHGVADSKKLLNAEPSFS